MIKGVSSRARKDVQIALHAGFAASGASCVNSAQSSHLCVLRISAFTSGEKLPQKKSCTRELSKPREGVVSFILLFLPPHLNFLLSFLPSVLPSLLSCSVRTGSCPLSTNQDCFVICFCSVSTAVPHSCCPHAAGPRNLRHDPSGLFHSVCVVRYVVPLSDAAHRASKDAWCIIGCEPRENRAETRDACGESPLHRVPASLWLQRPHQLTAPRLSHAWFLLLIYL